MNQFQRLQDLTITELLQNLWTYYELKREGFDMSKYIKFTMKHLRVAGFSKY